MSVKELLRAAYRLAIEADVTRLTSLIQLACSRDAVVTIGSGGALALAAFAADLVSSQTQRVAWSTTPLQLAGTTSFPGASVLLFSSRARHPDTALAIRLATERQMTPVGLITQRTQAELQDMLSHASV